MEIPVDIKQLNALAENTFVEFLGGVYEHSPWVAKAVTTHRPFKNVIELQSAMKKVVELADDEAKINLLKAHPEFAGKAAQQGTLTESSTQEQGRLSLNNLPTEQHLRMQQFNREFMEKYGFPGIVAVRLNKSVEDIFTQFEERLNNNFATEVGAAIQQVHAIAGFRLQDLVTDE